MRVEAKCPSNIALVKYWGKKDVQLPLNPSVSFTLSKAITSTSISFRPSSTFSFEFLFSGQKQPSFEPKIQHFFNLIRPEIEDLNSFHLTIESSNNFPHSSGIASSASAFGALAIALAEWQRSLKNLNQIDLNLASQIARMGSGSAARSVWPYASLWGMHSEILNSSDLYARPIGDFLHPIFKDYKDYIFLVDVGQKKVSSSQGHSLMTAHPFAKARIEQAFQNIPYLMDILKSGDLIKFISLIESEALTLHALMLSANKPYILMKPGTLAIIDAIWDYRQQSGCPVCFTLDAGSNVHMLFPASYEMEMKKFSDEVLSSYCSSGRYLCDEVGTGPTWQTHL